MRRRPVALLVTLAGAMLVRGGMAAAPTSARGDAAAASQPATSQQIIESAPPGDWRALPDEHTLYLELPRGRVIIELSPRVAPRMVARIEALARAHFYDGLPVERVQDNYVAQWGNGDGQHALPAGLAAVGSEMSTRIPAGDFRRFDLGDGYAPEVGFVASLPAGRDPATGQVWLAHCYGAVGVARGLDPASGDGTELYAVIGHAPRHLDLNVEVVGRVRQGMELLSSLPRGTGELGFYEQPAERTTIDRVRLASELPQDERTPLEVLRSDSASFVALLAARRNRSEPFFIHQAGYIDLCNVPLPVRTPPQR